MKRKLVALGAVGVTLIVAIAAYATEGNNYITGFSVNRSSCKSTDCSGDAVSCNITWTDNYGCDGQNNSYCLPYNYTYSTIGACTQKTFPNGAIGCECD